MGGVADGGAGQEVGADDVVCGDGAFEGGGVAAADAAVDAEGDDGDGR